MEADAISGLGNVYHQMGEFAKSLKYHQIDLEIAQSIGVPNLQSRAFGNLGSVHEALGNLEQAIRYQEEHLSVAASTNDQLGKTLAFSSLGRVHQLLGNTPQAVAYLTQGLCIAEALGCRDEEAKIRNRLGLALWSNGDLEGAQKQLEAATHLLEMIRRESRNSPDYKLSLFNLQTSSYQVLQRVLIELNREEEALLVAERGRNRAFVDLLLERQQNCTKIKHHGIANSIEQIKEIINRQRASVLYYSIAVGYLNSWLLVPSKGIVKFHSTPLKDPEDSQDSTGLLERLVTSVRDSLGVELSPCPTINEDQYVDDNMNSSGFLRMVNRQHLLNSSNYSLSSLFSLGSVGGSVASLQGSTRSSASTQGSTRLTKRQTWKGPACFHALYQLLIQPFEDSLSGNELILVLEGDLYLVPFPVLRPPTDPPSEPLCERFSLLVAPNLSSLRTNTCKTPQNDTIKGLVVGNPRIPRPVSERWGWRDLPQAEQEANLVGELLQAPVLSGNQATKEQVLSQLQEAECVHFATHVSWKLSSLVLSPAEVLDQPQTKRLYMSDNIEEDEGSEVSTSSAELPALSEFLLSAADLLSLKLQTKLVVISSSHTKDQQGWATSDGLVALVRALLASGAQAVLISLWPVPDTATKILLRAFYSALLQGTRAARALAEAMQTVQHTKHFAHPANWAGFLLIGLNVRLSNKVAMMGQALCELLRMPDKCRDALRVTLHLVEKSLQRIHRGQKNAMYTTQKSIENKVGTVNGWKELLMSVGFRFEPASNGIPSSVFFPQSDPDERLTQCSASLQALLGLSSTSIHALAKLTANSDVADDIIGVIQSVMSQFGSKNLDADNVEVSLSVRLWRVPGCHELLASLGFDLCDVGQDKVTLRTGKQANRRNIQFTLQALLALFDTQEAPKSLSIDSSSSMESLTSVDNDFPLSDNELQQQPMVRSRAAPQFSRTCTAKLGGAFTSYVRRRGEPDGRTADFKPPKAILPRPGGGESDAAFTPSPPVALQTETQNIALSLAHQTRIRNLYAAQNEKNDHRPDSSSSASSATDWDNNGHNTVLRRSQQQQPRPLFENSSDSELEKIDGLFNKTTRRLAQKKGRNLMSTLDRLSVRTEVSPAPHPTARKMLALPAEELSSHEQLLYFSPSDNGEKQNGASVKTERPDSPTKTSPDSKTGPSNTLHDTILATQLRHINRELTPTISEVYHERSIGLGLAPPLAKLLLNQGASLAPPTDGSALEQISLGVLDESDATADAICARCKLDSAFCACSKKTTNKPWLSELEPQILQKADLTTADILEREVKNKMMLRKEEEPGRSSPFSEMSRRDEGDGRSIADSNCSSYKAGAPPYNKPLPRMRALHTSTPSQRRGK